MPIMSPHRPYLHISTTRRSVVIFIITVFFYLLHSTVSCFVYQRQIPSISPRGLLFEEKARLGSVPPSCHNNCNGCHPCMAAQVPTLPSHNNPVDLGLTKSTNKLFEPFPAGNRYSNYKPLDWKCRCGDHFYNP